MCVRVFPTAFDDDLGICGDAERPLVRWEDGPGRVSRTQGQENAILDELRRMSWTTDLTASARALGVATHITHVTST